ncbi:DMT family transporter [Peptoniphilus equinus]|uniref:DMT family transporter n=1 Tax=Peptoniphilus equinus TaxID=3016343 RepID=A0ABY7QUZ4_9FIRM|nr:DMT family transporter [Peptoniphilus equinus]WBW49855.1 DMT family transporter [Peptoniphilus equinus]
MKTNYKSVVYILLAAVIWGFAFVAQAEGIEHIGSFTFTAIRGFIGGGLILLLYKTPLKHVLTTGKVYADHAMQRRAGLWCGLLLFVSINLQQLGIAETTTAKAGFITTLYIVIIPIILFFRGERISPRIFFCIGLALVGFYFLCITDGFTLSRGDILIFLSAILFSVHILVLSHFTPLVDPVKLNGDQFIVGAALSAVVAFFFEPFDISGLSGALPSLLYVGVLSSAVAYTLQIVGIRDLNPTVAALLSSLESIFAAIGGFLILHQVLSVREIIGCAIVFTATLFTQLGGSYDS